MGEKRKLNLVVFKEKKFDSGKTIYKCTTQDGQDYDCWEAKIKEFVGKGEHEFNVYSKERDGRTNWYIDLKEPGEKSGGGKWGGGKTYTPSFKDTAEGAKLTAKTMLMSYAKDLVCKHMEFKPVEFTDYLKNVGTAYAAMLPVIGLDGIKDPAPTDQKTPGTGTNGNGNGHKTITVLLAELKAFTEKAAFANWWHTNTESIKALSDADRKNLITEKSKKITEIEKTTKPVDKSEIPFD